jgi:hypothetical protein
LFPADRRQQQALFDAFVCICVGGCLIRGFSQQNLTLKTAAFKVSQSIEDLKNTYKELISLEENISKSYRDLEEKQKALISAKAVIIWRWKVQTTVYGTGTWKADISSFL